jgi:hypothetical protein
MAIQGSPSRVALLAVVRAPLLRPVASFLIVDDSLIPRECNSGFRSWDTVSRSGRGYVNEFRERFGLL